MLKSWCKERINNENFYSINTYDWLTRHEHLDVVDNIKYNDKLSCLVDRAIMSNDSIVDSDDTTKSSTYFCADSLLYRVK